MFWFCHDFVRFHRFLFTIDTKFIRHCEASQLQCVSLIILAEMLEIVLKCTVM